MTAEGDARRGRGKGRAGDGGAGRRRDGRLQGRRGSGTAPGYGTAAGSAAPVTRGGER